MILGDATNPATYRFVERGSINAVITSPPYALQRAYGGAQEEEYPYWTVRWMEHIKPLLKPDGSVAMVIRSNVRNGAVDPYVLKTRLALHQAGWREPEELIWHKRNGPPMGHTGRPRRSWEHILWFALPGADGSVRCFCDPRANGKRTVDLGYNVRAAQSAYTNTAPRAVRSGIARSTDVAEVMLADNGRNIDHPAVYPPALAKWIMKLICPPGGRVLDPFIGSGSTAVAAEELGCSWVGVELHGEYVDLALSRLRDRRQQNADIAERYPLQVGRWSPPAARETRPKPKAKRVRRTPGFPTRWEAPPAQAS